MTLKDQVDQIAKRPMCQTPHWHVLLFLRFAPRTAACWKPWGKWDWFHRLVAHQEMGHVPWELTN